MKRFYCSLLILVLNLHGNIGTYGFVQFKNHYFVETGTFRGDAVARALKEGFQEVYSIEFFDILVKSAKKRFENFKNVTIIHGDSKNALWDIIKDLDKPITFWLDAHIYPPHEGIVNCPLIQELEQIKKHPIKTHTILIDDLSCCDTLAFDYLSLHDLINKIKEINFDYVFELLAGGDNDEVKNNVLCARIPAK
ncbi:TPA: hypothetical protein DIC20_04180 [Candidatus Dependentiae bacterium]|nr:MAG: hypothetical protein US03_C0004G0065 [candidate division TM6 bacterium GW2011_GWF2_36_131]KKQ03243.1 MAG: hypothetical protein US13_C0004G0065 [candidate division TM6 bacterium GW2011_GWE2_36_25]KKQ19834.1 MAG: hypothetical protein US32_C0004G0018 [candidate division TM6 bacterium GW2011_GWA2_36_9]HBR70328.1 hypothetical protein [Candidatus Dependentiae bacterium]HCU00873.1 hypothetical protein [Candidatus Dependentiae bacterium]